MKSKLQGGKRGQLTWSSMEFGPKAPHIVYANHNFLTDEKDTDFDALLASFDDQVLMRTEHFREFMWSQQDQFRRCLEWLSLGAVIMTGRVPSQKLDVAANTSVRKWVRDPRVKFLELHGTKHADILLRPGAVRSHPWRCYGLAFAQALPRDPLDLICWYVIGLHLGDALNVRVCHYKGCRRFFEPKTLRRIYCKDICRALDHRKSPEESRAYMRNYRAIKRRLRSNKSGIRP